MPITLNDITPVGLCIATEELFDAKRFRANFCDNILLRTRDKNLEIQIMPIKKQLNALGYQGKFIMGHKTAIINNLDKILSMVTIRYGTKNLKTVDAIVNNGKELIKKVILADTFDQIASLQSLFKSQVSLPVYSLFIESMRKSDVPMV